MLSKEELILKSEELNESKKYQEVIELLNIDVLEKYTDSELFAEKARAYINIKEYSEGEKLLKKAFKLSPDNKKNYLYKGILFTKLKQYEKAIDYYSKVIDYYSNESEINPNLVKTYYWRGHAFRSLDMNKEAFKDYYKASELDPSDYKIYYGIGNLYLDLKNYETAIENFNKVIELVPNFPQAYNNRGVSYSHLEKYNDTINNYNKAIELNPKYSLPYFNRASLYRLNNKLKEAINDYKKIIDLSEKDNEYFIELSKSRVLELEKKLNNSYYNDISELILKVKKILVFNQKCLTHYTSLSVAKILILNKNEFRLSEGSFLNDTSEGKELFKYLDFPKKSKNNTKTTEENFIEKPFIGSFVSESKHNDLTLWRMYGKEALTEAKGCAITFERDKFISNLNEKLNPINPFDNDLDFSNQNDDQFTFYKVAYMDNNKNKFNILDAEEKDVEELNKVMIELQNQIKNLKPNQKSGKNGQKLLELLNQITYLFKSSEYQYEHEVRLVLDGVGFKKRIEGSNNDVLPRVYIELINITPIINKITLGPKVEKADEWASAFNYSLKNDEHEAQIVISHLPFK